MPSRSAIISRLYTAARDILRGGEVDTTHKSCKGGTAFDTGSWVHDVLRLRDDEYTQRLTVIIYDNVPITMVGLTGSLKGEFSNMLLIPPSLTLT